MNTKWNDMTPLEKVIFVITCIGAAFVVLANSKPDLFPINLTYPIIALVTVLEAVACWKKKRKWAYLLIAGTVISLGCFILELCLLG